MKTQIVNPNLGNFIKSLRDVGYTFEIAVADILDNSITAKASIVKIHTVAEPEVVFSMLDNGAGMTDEQLVEAMRLATRDPDDSREKTDLGRFGLGLKNRFIFPMYKTYCSFKKRWMKVSAKQWDLELISETNEWRLITPSTDELDSLPLIDELRKQKKGTLVVWQNIDRYKKDSFVNEIDKLRNHLALVFHRFLEAKFKPLKIFVNNNQIKSFDPFNSSHHATQEGTAEQIKLFKSKLQFSLLYFRTIQSFRSRNMNAMQQKTAIQNRRDFIYTDQIGF